MAVQKTDQKAKKPKAEPPREPTIKERRMIMDLLEEVYDVENSRYQGDETDQTVSDVLKMPPKWISDIRDSFFGPSAGNGDMVELAAALAAVQMDLATDEKRISTLLNANQLMRDRVATLEKRLQAIQTAVGQRVMVGVKS